MLARILPNGTFVMVKREVRTKLEPRYGGLYRVTERTRLGHYMLERLKGRSLIRPVHPSRVKPVSPELASRILAAGPFIEEKDDDEAQEEEEYKVERLLAHQNRKGTLHYLVKWEGFDEPTWVSAQDVLTAKCIKDYWNRFMTLATYCPIKTSHCQLADELTKWLSRILPKIDVDICGRTHKFPLCRQRVEEFFRDGIDQVRYARSLWINPPWHWYLWLGDWLRVNARGKRIYVVVPHYRGYDRRIGEWDVEWEMEIPFPPECSHWFKLPTGDPRVKPTWKCSIWIGTHVPWRIEATVDLLIEQWLLVNLLINYILTLNWIISKTLMFLWKWTQQPF